MKLKIISIITIITLFLPDISFSETKEVPFTLADRDRILRLEENIKRLDEKIDTKFDAQNAKFESIQKQISNINILMYFVLGAIFSLVGFVLWDRRSTLRPVERKNREIENKNSKIIKILEERAKTDEKLREILKNVAIY
jgi:tetrahydromethanopterin S-methyltransferase subunit G